MQRATNLGRPLFYSFQIFSSWILTFIPYKQFRISLRGFEFRFKKISCHNTIYKAGIKP